MLYQSPSEKCRLTVNMVPRIYWQWSSLPYDMYNISYGDCTTIGKLCIATKSYISGTDLRVKNGVFSKMFGRLTQ